MKTKLLLAAIFALPLPVLASQSIDYGCPSLRNIDFGSTIGGIKATTDWGGHKENWVGYFKYGSKDYPKLSGLKRVNFECSYGKCHPTCVYTKVGEPINYLFMSSDVTVIPETKMQWGFVNHGCIVGKDQSCNFQIQI